MTHSQEYYTVKAYIRTNRNPFLPSFDCELFVRNSKTDEQMVIPDDIEFFGCPSALSEHRHSYVLH